MVGRREGDESCGGGGCCCCCRIGDGNCGGVATSGTTGVGGGGGGRLVGIGSAVVPIRETNFSNVSAFSQFTNSKLQAT